MQITSNYNQQNFNGLTRFSRPKKMPIKPRNYKIIRPSREIVVLNPDGTVNNGFCAKVTAKFVRGWEVVHSKFYDTFMVPYYKANHINHKTKLYSGPKRVIQRCTSIAPDGTTHKTLIDNVRDGIDKIASVFTK